MSQFDWRGMPPAMALRDDLEIAPSALHAQLTDPSFAAALLLVDVRTKEEYEAARINPSLHVPLHELEGRVDEVLETAAGRKVVTICHHGVRSLKASLILRHHGCAAALSLAGGTDLWSQSVDATVKRYERDGSQIRVLS